MMPRFSLLLAALGLVLGSPLTSWGALVTSSAGIPSPSTVNGLLDYASGSASTGGFVGGSGAFLLSNTPRQVGNTVGENIIWTSTITDSVIGDTGYGLSTNGEWNQSRQGFAATNSESAEMFFTFGSGPLSAVGGLVNYAPTSVGGTSVNFTLTAYGAGMTVLEQYNIYTLAPISTPLGNGAGAFRGIVRGTADIIALGVKGQYGVIDDLTFSRFVPSPVPEPSTLVLSSLGTLALTLYRRRRTRSVPRPTSPPLDKGGLGGSGTANNFHS